MEYQLAGSSQQVAPLSALAIVADPLSLSDGRNRMAALRSNTPLLAPSLLMCDFAHLADEIQKLEAAGVRVLHLDVMDGTFVPNLTYGLPIVEAVRRVTRLPIEAHLMIARPERYASQFVAAGADGILFHVEAVDDPRPLLDALHRQGAAAGLAYNPDTPLASVLDYVDHCDAVLTMSVSPGFGGQAFNPVALDNLRTLRARVGDNVLLEIDGGVNETTIAACTEAGAQLCVVGSEIFKTSDYSQTVDRLTRLAQTSSRVC